MQETWVQILSWEDPLEKETATFSSTLAWKIPWTEELGRLQSMGFEESDTTERLHFHFNVYKQFFILYKKKDAKIDVKVYKYISTL